MAKVLTEDEARRDGAPNIGCGSVAKAMHARRPTFLSTGPAVGEKAATKLYLMKYPAVFHASPSCMSVRVSMADALFWKRA